jgi:hypothetical protein
MDLSLGHGIVSLMDLLQGHDCIFKGFVTGTGFYLMDLSQGQECIFD